MDTNTPPTAGQSGQTGQQPGAAGPRVTWDDVKDVRRLRRSGSERTVAGVAGGLARHLDVDPLLVRIGFGVLTLFAGAGVVLYLGLWLFLPEDGSDRAPLGLDARSRNVALAGVAVVTALVIMGNWGTSSSPWPWILLVGAAGWFLARGVNGDGTSWSSPVRDAQQPERWADADARVTAYRQSVQEPFAQGPPTPQTSVQEPWQQTPSPTVDTPAVAPFSAPDTTHAAQAPRTPRPLRRTRREDPRRRGPVLFWIVLALAALGGGVLGCVQLSGVDVPASAYPALVTALAAAGLLLGAFWGRAGGLIALGVVAAVTTAGVTTVEEYPRKDVRIVPAVADQVQNTYDFRAGTFLLDLSDVADPKALVDHSIHVAAGVGDVEVVVPEGLPVSVQANVGLGDAWVLGNSHSGIGISHGHQNWNGTDSGNEDGWVPNLRINVDLGVGQVTVREANDTVPFATPSSSAASISASSTTDTSTTDSTVREETRR